MSTCQSHIGDIMKKNIKRWSKDEIDLLIKSNQHNLPVLDRKWQKITF